MQTKFINDITNEDFEIPEYTADLQQTIDAAIDIYYDMGAHQHKRKNWRIKLNELIEEYNEIRGMKIYNFVK